MNGAPEVESVASAIERVVTQSGETIVALSMDQPVLLVFLRHAGCTFCREALSDIARYRTAIEGVGARIALVHMGKQIEAEKIVRKYGLRGVDLISDPGRDLYRAFGLARGTLLQLFGPKVIRRGIKAGLIDGHGLGAPAGDTAQMPGVFLLDRCEIVRRFRHRTAADRPDYIAIVARSK